MSSMNFNYSEMAAILPSPTYVVISLFGAIVVMGSISMFVFCKKDMNFQARGY